MGPSFYATLDELEKLGAISLSQAQAAADRLDTLDRNKATPGRIARYAAIGGTAAPAINAIGNIIRKKPAFEGANMAGKLRDAAASSAKGALGASAIPIARQHFDRKAEEGTLQRYLATVPNVGY